VGISSQMVRITCRSLPRQCAHWLAMTEDPFGAALAPSVRGLAKIGISEPIFDWGSVLTVAQPSDDTPSVSLRLPPSSAREAKARA